MFTASYACDFLSIGSVIRGWDVGVATMKRGELAKFTIKSEFAYGKSGSPPKIPADATLIFEIELFDWKGNFKNITKKNKKKHEMLDPDIRYQCSK